MPNPKLVLRRKTGESWLEAALRLARPHGLENEVRLDYELNLSGNGRNEEEAAFHACYEWDVLEISE